MIHIHALVADSGLSKFRGLMFQKKINPLYLEIRFGIHTFFLKAPIVVVILDKQSVVRKIKTLMPWRVFFWNPKYYRVLELPVGHKDTSKLKLGDKVKLDLEKS